MGAESMREVGRCCAKPAVTDFSGKGPPGSAHDFTHRYCGRCGAHEFGRENVVFYTRAEWDAWIEESNRWLESHWE